MNRHILVFSINLVALIMAVIAITRQVTAPTYFRIEVQYGQRNGD